MSGKRKVELVYDGSCPVCNFYSRHVGIDSDEGPVRRVDAREPGELLDIVTGAGLDPDDGMVVRIDGELYFGAEALHRLARLGSHDALTDRLIALLFRSRRRAEIAYPVLKACRNLLLKLLGRPRINNPGRCDSARP